MIWDKISVVNFNAGYNPEINTLDNNLWQLKHYEKISNKVYVLFLNHSSKKKIIRNGNTILVFAGNGSFIKNILLSPFKILFFKNRMHFQCSFTYEQVYLFWIYLFINKAKTPIHLIPITIPRLMYQITGKSLTYKIPISIEKILLKFSSLSCNSVITSKSLGEYIKWLQKDFIFNKKLKILDVFVEEIPSPFFLDKISEKSYLADNKTQYNALLISRLKSEKCVDHAIKAIKIILENGIDIKLTIIGQGEDLLDLKKLVLDLNLSNHINFVGQKTLFEISDYYESTDVFISPLTGSALREVAFYGMPVIAYNMDWLNGTLTNNFNYFGVEAFNINMLALRTIELLKDQTKRQYISNNIKTFAFETWGSNKLLDSYKKI